MTLAEKYMLLDDFFEYTPTDGKIIASNDVQIVSDTLLFDFFTYISGELLISFSATSKYKVYENDVLIINYSTIGSGINLEVKARCNYKIYATRTGSGAGTNYIKASIIPKSNIGIVTRSVV